ncbi:MAG: cardiolipin synthase [Blastocatellia bacterium]|jgi:cardiolipin synthase|nr:cardiolipin synthase [Blastocatellia bacterium]
MEAKILVDFDEFWARLSEDIRTARDSIFVQTLACEGDTIGKLLAASLLAAPATDKRVLADSFTRIVLSDKFRFSPGNLLDAELRREARETTKLFQELKQGGVQLKFTNPYGFTPRSILSRNHKKLIVIDERVAYFGGMNFSEHNAAWHDMMLRIEDPQAVAFLREDFLSTWSGHDRKARAKFAGLELCSLDGHANAAAFGRVLDLIDASRQAIFVESPYITFPFYERLRNASRRGVAVTIVTPEENNWGFFADYARLESTLSQIDLRFYQGRMSHLKAMLIDDQYLIAGSSNFDYLSYRMYQETLAVITDGQLIAEFRERVMLPDMANAKSVQCQASLAALNWLRFKVKVLDTALTILT